MELEASPSSTFECNTFIKMAVNEGKVDDDVVDEDNSNLRNSVKQSQIGLSPKKMKSSFFPGNSPSIMKTVGEIEEGKMFSGERNL